MGSLCLQGPELFHGGQIGGAVGHGHGGADGGFQLEVGEDFQIAPGLQNAEVSFAVDALLRMGLLEFREGKLSKTFLHLNTDEDHELEYDRQLQSLSNSKKSFESVPLFYRKHETTTVAVDPKKLPEAKQMIEKFIGELRAFLEDGSAETVYEINLGLYPVQKLELPH